MAGAIACVRPRAAQQDPRDAVLDAASPEPAERSRRLSSSGLISCCLCVWKAERPGNSEPGRKSGWRHGVPMFWWQ